MGANLKAINPAGGGDGPLSDDGESTGRSNPIAPAQPGQTDRDLVRRFQTGDEVAFTEIVRRYHRRMFHVALRVLHDSGDAEEIAQDTLLRAHRALGDFRGDASLSTWLHRIAYNLSCHRYWYWFRRRRHATFSLDQTPPENGSQVGDFIPSDAASPAAEATSADFRIAIDRCVAGLSAAQRDLLHRRCVREQSYDEIARALHLEIGTIKSRLSRARAALRQALTADSAEYSAAGFAAAGEERGRTAAPGAWRRA